MNSFYEVILSEDGQSVCRITIEESLQENDIDSLKHDLLCNAKIYQNVQIVIRKLNALALPALQWIMAFQRAAQTEGKKVILDIDLTDQLQTLVDQSGLFTKFNWSE